ncbi:MULTISPECIES: acyl-CoA synthetase [unclassified Mycobacterium]|uniref:acyl-CoA synthetase n=1 Tax=unclassified Mycobacterium TaxID=2642494 RepID=UPI000A857099|nr:MULTISPECIES: acyl-CoA synthetase [unclassified Mycobacterium]
MTDFVEGTAQIRTDRDRLDEDDHDLLTFVEAGERLRIEIASVQCQLEQCRRLGTPQEVDSAQRRLDALRAAAQRNSAQPINDENFEKFFGYPGKARRNASAGDEQVSRDIIYMWGLLVGLFPGFTPRGW